MTHRLRQLVLVAVALPLVSAAQERAAGGETEAATFVVDSDASWLRVLVYRGGLLGAFGHNHVVSHDGITGTLTLRTDPLDAEISLEFAADGLAVDDPAERNLAGPDFPGQISEKDVAGTRANMLGEKLLQADEYPMLEIRSQEITGSLPDVSVRATVVVRGTEHPVVFPASVVLSGDSFVAGGELEISHRELGLKPFTAALGTLRVRDKLVLQYEISGKRTGVPE